MMGERNSDGTPANGSDPWAARPVLTVVIPRKRETFEERMEADALSVAAQYRYGVAA